MTQFPDSLDPQLAHTVDAWTAIYNSYLPLLTYNHASGRAGSRIVPGLAKALPTLSPDGRTYRLTLRPGLTYSNGRPVRASDFKYAVKRLLKLDSTGSPFYINIVGAARYQRSKRGDIRGIQTNDASGQIKIRLVQPRGTFIDELALPYVAPVPADTPAKDQTLAPPPATGPLEITQVDPQRGWVEQRNPQWSANNAKLIPSLPSGEVKKIEISIIRNPATQVSQIEDGQLDWMFDPPPPDQLAEVRKRYLGTQYRDEPTVSTYYFWMNTRRAPFSDLRVRRAVNYAIDPAAMKRIYAGQLQPLQQILPPAMPGFRRFELYPHNMAKAKQLIAAANPKQRNIKLWVVNESPNEQAGLYLQDLLERLGFKVELKDLGSTNYFGVIGNANPPGLDIGWTNWFEDYPHPTDFFSNLLDGSSIRSVNNANLSLSNIPRLNRQITRLAARPLTAAVERRYSALDKAFMQTAPWAPYGTRILSTFVSDRIDLDRVIWNPTFEDDLTSFHLR